MNETNKVYDQIMLALKYGEAVLVSRGNMYMRIYPMVNSKGLHNTSNWCDYAHCGEGFSCGINLDCFENGKAMKDWTIVKTFIPQYPVVPAETEVRYKMKKMYVHGYFNGIYTLAEYPHDLRGYAKAERHEFTVLVEEEEEIRSDADWFSDDEEEPKTFKVYVNGVKEVHKHYNLPIICDGEEGRMSVTGSLKMKTVTDKDGKEYYLVPKE